MMSTASIQHIHDEITEFLTEQNQGGPPRWLSRWCCRARHHSQCNGTFRHPTSWWRLFVWSIVGMEVVLVPKNPEPLKNGHFEDRKTPLLYRFKRFLGTGWIVMSYFTIKFSNKIFWYGKVLEVNAYLFSFGISSKKHTLLQNSHIPFEKAILSRWFSFSPGGICDRFPLEYSSFSFTFLDPNEPTNLIPKPWRMGSQVS